MKNTQGTLYLYGSRTDDSLKGGDIDLLLTLPDPAQSEKMNMQRPEILNAFKKKLGDRRIDFTIRSQEEAEKDSFFSDILRTAIPLKKF
jgi:hypothetical protein